MTKIATVNASGPNLADITTYHDNLTGKRRLFPCGIELTKDRLVNKIGKDSPVAEIQSCVPRIRHAWGEAVKNMIAVGSGFVIDPNGFILTNAHVADAINTGQLYADFTLLKDQRLPVNFTPDDIDPEINEPMEHRKIDVFPIPYQVLVSDPLRDLAILIPKIPECQDEWKRLGFNTSELTKDTVVIGLGHGDSDRHCSAFSGRVIDGNYSFNKLVEENTANKRFVDFRKKLADKKWEWHRNSFLTEKSIMSTIPFMQGDSGGPLCDPLGGILGVNSIFIPPVLLQLANCLLAFCGTQVPSHKTYSQGVEGKIFPFFKDIGVEPDDVLAGKPLNFSDIIFQKYKRKLV